MDLDRLDKVYERMLGELDAMCGHTSCWQFFFIEYNLLKIEIYEYDYAKCDTNICVTSLGIKYRYFLLGFNL